MGILAGRAALRDSVTFDEVAHIGAGLSYLQKLDLRFNEEHPPLAKVIAAVPLVLDDTRADYTHITWTNSTKFLPHAFLGEWVFGEWVLTRWNSPRRTLALARLPMLLLTLVLGGVVFLYGRKLGGDWGGLLSISAYVSAPSFLAFGPLVLTDLAIALFFLLTLWQFAEVWREPSRWNAFRFALCLSGALLSKFSSGLLFVAFGAFALSTRFRPLPGLPREKTKLRNWRRQRWGWTQKATVLAAIIVYGFYFLLSLNQSTDALNLLGHSEYWVPLRRILMPPWLYLRGLGMFVLTSSRPTFLLGHIYEHGVWFYFPVILVLKSPLGFLGLLALLLALALWLKRRRGAIPALPEADAFHWRVIWVSLLVYAAACMFSNMTISIRHFSVPLVLLIVMLAPLPRMIQALADESVSWARAARALTVLLAASSLVSAVRAYPHYLPFFNALTWSHPAYWWASDSNVDFNQSLPEVRDFANRHAVESLPLDQYAMTDPITIVPQARLWDCQAPTAADAGQWVVVSSNMILDQHNCSWLMQYPREMLGGGSMWAVHLPPAIPAAGAPGGPPPPFERRTYLGMPEDPRVANINLVRHPEQLPSICAAAEAQMRAYFGR